MMLRRVARQHESIFDRPQKTKIVESVKKGVSKGETARRFGVHRATVKRYCKRLDERGTLEPDKAPAKRGRSWTRRRASYYSRTSDGGRGQPTLKGHSSC